MSLSLITTNLFSTRSRRSMPPRIPPPSHRHAAPSGPWPWMDLESEVDPLLLAQPRPPAPRDAAAGAWVEYPRALFPNWTPEQTRRSGIGRAVHDNKGFPCVLYYADVAEDGQISAPARGRVAVGDKPEELWQVMQQPRPKGVRVRALFVENMSGPVLQMLGTKYNIEPFFFSSSLNWIPSRYQEDVRLAQGDHITVTLTFVRTMQNPMTAPPTPTSTTDDGKAKSPALLVDVGQVIDTQAPLALRSTDKILLLDLLAIHMVRDEHNSTIVSYHPTPEWHGTSAQHLHSRVCFAGQSVFWQNIFKKSRDPTFVLLAILWYSLYAWDEALETLYAHICWLESRVLSTNDMRFTQELHIVSAHLLFYQSLLEDFRKSVNFVRDTPNPAMRAPAWTDAEQEESRALMEKECSNLLSEIERLEMSRAMQTMRLQNVQNLVFSSVNLEDSRHMRWLTEAAVRDSAAMKQISYLTMIFLPASFVAGVFGMNIKELTQDGTGTLAHYFATFIPLTALTVWVIIAFQSKHHIHDPDTGLWTRLQWPVRAVWWARGTPARSGDEAAV